MTRWAMAADLNRCVGCQTCTAACKQANATAPGIQWRKVVDFEAGEYPNVRRAFVPVGCMHCDDPPCLEVCPSTATRKRDDGIVTIDYDICIGCSYCAVACPYQARYRVDTPNEAYGTHLSMNHEVVREHWDRRAVAQKCTYCVQRIDQGLAEGKRPGSDPEATPACVNSCIAGALTFGDTDDPDSEISRLLQTNHHSVMHADLGTGPGIFYLWARGEQPEPDPESPLMIKDPVGLGLVSPAHQEHWDIRAAANFIFGGTGTGLITSTMVVGLFAPTIWFAAALACCFVGLGLFCVWLEIGRPWRFLNVFRHAQTSWMTREALVAVPLFGFFALAWLLDSQVLGLVSAAFGLLFLYCQGQILRAAKGIPAWRQRGISQLIFSTGLAEGLGLFSVVALWAQLEPTLISVLTVILIVLVGLRFMLWVSYRADLGKSGAPTETLAVFDGDILSFSPLSQIAVTLVATFGFFYPPALPLAGLLTLASGWNFKKTLITRAAFNQGYEIPRMPARGAGKSARGIKPGWTMT